MKTNKIILLLLTMFLIANIATAQNTSQTDQMTPQQWVEWMNTLNPAELYVELEINPTPSQLDAAGIEQFLVWKEKATEWKSIQDDKTIQGNNETIQGNNETIQGNNEIIEEKERNIESYLNGTNPDVQKILQNVKEIASLTSVDEAWIKYGEMLEKYGFTKQDLEQN